MTTNTSNFLHLITPPMVKYTTVYLDMKWQDRVMHFALWTRKGGWWYKRAKRQDRMRRKSKRGWA